MTRVLTPLAPLAACVVMAAAASFASAQARPASRGDVPLASLVSRADLHYSAPAPRPEEGQPIGGRAGDVLVQQADLVAGAGKAAAPPLFDARRQPDVVHAEIVDAVRQRFLGTAKTA